MIKICFYFRLHPGNDSTNSNAALERPVLFDSCFGAYLALEKGAELKRAPILRLAAGQTRSALLTYTLEDHRNTQIPIHRPSHS